MEQNPNKIADQLKMEAVKELLRRSDDPIDKVKLSDVERIERQAGMTPSEQVKDMERDNTPYKDSRMTQRFTSIRAVKAVDGFIYVDVDEAESRKNAQLTAFRVLGPLAPHEDIVKYIEQHTDHSKLMTVKQFINNLRTVLAMVRIAPQYFGDGHGGGEIKDIMDASFAAIKQARAWLKAHNNLIPPHMAKLLLNEAMQISDKTKFVEMLGDGWETKVANAPNALAAKNLVLGNDK